MKQLIKTQEISPFDIYDITVENDHCFQLNNGIIAHNSMFPKDIVSGGTGSYYSSSTVFILGRQQDKEGTDLVGFNFIINVDKSRYVKEKSKIPITVSFEGGISKYSGLIDVAEEAGYVVKPAKGWYSKVDKSTGVIEEKKYRFKDTNTKEFWDSILDDISFQEWVQHRYQIGSHYTLEEDHD